MKIKRETDREHAEQEAADQKRGGETGRKRRRGRGNAQRSAAQGTASAAESSIFPACYSLALRRVLLVALPLLC